MKTSVIDIELPWSTPELTLEIAAVFEDLTSKTFTVCTTGSSGAIKRVQISSAALFTATNLTNSAIGATPGDIWSLLLPTNHIAGLNVLARAVTLESKVVGVNERADFTAIVPTQLHRALTGDTELLKHLKLCKKVLVGGAGTSQKLLNLAAENGIQIITTYGMTETCGGFIYNNVPLPAHEVALTVSGKLKVKAATLAFGYENASELWHQNFTNGWFTTNDLAEIRGDKVFILGRVDDVIISGGLNISLAAVEAELSIIFPDVNFVATSIPDPEWGAMLCLVSDSEIDRAKIAEILASKLGKHCVPKEYVLVETIPLIGIGKPDRVKAALLFQSK